jgi:DNA (cytosine-5)-methyltransferase 1
MLKKSQLQIRIDADLESRFVEACHAQGVTVSGVLRTIISAYCDDVPVSSNPTPKAAKMNRSVRKLNEVLSADKPRFEIGEMFCGPGGIAVGASRATVKIRDKIIGFEHGWATDYDPDTCQTYANNIIRNSSNGIVVCKDVRELDVTALPKTEGFLYGFPCNDFSLVGETKGLTGRFGPLYRHGINYIDHANPLFILAENVGGLSSANSGQALEQISNDLATAGKYGYRLTRHLYRFEEYGVPQARHRLIIVGIRKDLKLQFEVPKPSGRIISCREAIEKPPIPKNATNNELTAQAKQVVERLSFIKPGENAWTADLPQRLRLNVTGAQLSQIYKRLDPTKPAYTITGSGGGGTHVYHWKENRALTNRERARLQTFPDNFEFFGSKESVRKQIGMAVPPKGAQVILEAVLKTLTGVNYRTTKPSRGYLG